MTPHAIAAGHRLTCDAADEALRAGGTAVDAAISAALTATVAEPVLAGLLGGGFLMVRPDSGRAQVLDFFVQTPRRAVTPDDLDFREIEADFGTATQAFHIGAGTMATPGVVPGLAEAHARFGRMSWPDLAAPAIRAAREGVAISAYQAELARIVGSILTASPDSCALHCEGDTLKGEGEVFRNPALADVLEVMAHEGPRFVTEGEVAAALLALSENGGHLTRADLAGYRAEWREPLTVERGGARVSLNPPPSIGGALIAFALALAPNDPDTVALAEVLRLTAAARVEADLAADPVAGAARLMSDKLRPRYAAMFAQRATRGTTHISVIDASGMGAALTLSNGEGCGLIAPGTGIMPNNMLGEADLVPGGWHSWKPDTRLSSMMCPLAVDWSDGRTAMLGSGGSNRIRTALVQVLVRMIDRRERLADAIEAPRLHVEGHDPAEVDFEDIAGEAHRAALLDAFPEARPWPGRSMFFGGAHGVLRGPRGDLDAAGDPRRAGVAIR